MVTLRRHRIAMALGLMLLAPTVGEYLLGNIPISQYGDVLVLMPLYGAGALLVRGVRATPRARLARRSCRSGRRTRWSRRARSTR